MEDELLERCIEGSGIFLIWADRPIRMNSAWKGRDEGGWMTSIERFG